VSKMVSKLFTHLCLEVACKLANISQLAWVLDCCYVSSLTLHVRSV
jgi:hypothetical protein